MRAPSFTVRGLVSAALFALAMFLTAPASAEQTQPGPAVGAADVAAIRQVIQDQLAAFQRDDGAAAFGYATPAIREMFRTPEIFMSMVKSGYQPVYRPRHVEFGIIDTVEGQLTQHLIVTGPDGAVVEALYFMEQQKDGTWLVNGCVLKPSYQA